MRGICGLSEETSAAEEGICSVGLVTKRLRLVYLDRVQCRSL